MSNWGAKTKEALFWNSALKGAVQIITIIVSIFLARILDPYDFGVMATGMIIISYANTISDFGFLNAIIQMDDADEETVNSVFTVNLIISLILFASTLFSAQIISKFFNSPDSEQVIRVLSFVFIITSFTGVFGALLKRNIEHKTLAGISAISTIVSYVIAITLAILKFRYWALAVGTLSNHFIALLLFLTRVSWTPKLQYSHRKMKSVFNFGAWNFLRAQIFYFNNYVMHLFIGRTMNVQSLGLFDKGFEISAKPSKTLGKSINAVMFSSFSRLKKNRNQLQTWFSNMLTIQFIFILPIYIGMYTVASHFVPVVLGNKWNELIDILKILLAARMIISITSGMTTYCIAIGEYRAYTIRTFITSFFLLIFCGFAYQKGVIGISYAYLSFTVLNFLATIDLVFRKSELKLMPLLSNNYLYMIGNMILLMTVSALASLVLRDLTWTNLIVLCFSGAFIFGTWTLFCNKIMRRHLFYPIPKKV
ncbi:MAG: lipopolysaccharide biosynthesis protein [Spirochaetes bacterium]|nr:lipopolysaccharide biosynthesis protein [Spirochaetota bacterium]